MFEQDDMDETDMIDESHAETDRPLSPILHARRDSTMKKDAMLVEADFGVSIRVITPMANFKQITTSVERRHSFEHTSY